jgi:hypothetical protein
VSGGELEGATARERRLLGCTVAGTPKDWVFAVILLSWWFIEFVMLFEMFGN